MALAREAVVLLGGLSLAGLVLPDARLERFLIDRGGRLWLANLSGSAAAKPPHDAQFENLKPARAVARELLRGEPRSSKTAALLTLVDAAPDLAALAALLI